MSPEEIAAYLAQPLIADFVTLRADGSPHVAPVWYEYADGKFLVFTSRKFQRVRNLERDNRAAVSVPTPGAPYAYVVAEGRATVTREGVAEVARSITARYSGDAAEVEAFLAETLDEDSVVVVLTPHRVMSWSDESG